MLTFFCPDPAYRVCALPGARPGETTVKGEVYLKTTYDFDVDEMSLDIVVVLLFWLFFTVINFYLVETANWAAGMSFLLLIIFCANKKKGGFMMKVFKKGKAPKRNLELELENARLAAKAADEMPKIEMVCSQQ